MVSRQFFPYLVLVSVVAIVAIAVLVLNNSSSLEGANVADAYREQVKELQPSCLDNDPRNEYDVKGTVHMGTYKNYDYCRGNRLVQAHCESSNSVGWVEYECPGGCSNGFCL
ncbi:hypothetical protein J4479_04760 [Candidatus Woesearchaeota archaeon]|nr:hypothetical protein [Candidatus Woesearchaeota archaeon]